MKELGLILAIPGSAALLLIGLLFAFFGWLKIMLLQVELEGTTQPAARLGWTLLIMGLTTIVWSIARVL